MDNETTPQQSVPDNTLAPSIAAPREEERGWPHDKSAIPNGFVCRPGGLYFRAEDGQGLITEEWVCSPLEVLAMTRDEHGQDWGRLLAMLDPDGTEHLWAMPMSMMGGGGEDYRRALLSRGLRIAAGKGNTRLHTYLATAEPKGRAQCVHRIGWHGRIFILPDAVYGDQGGEQILLQGVDTVNALQVSGSLAEWQEYVGQLCTGNSRLAFAVSAALATPLLHLVNLESGGFHFKGGSSLGKTTALHVAGSICGGGRINGYIRQWRATANGLEGIAAGSCDCLLCLDEMSQVDSATAGETAYMLANGQGKSRAGRNGGGQAPSEWRILFLSTGEVSLADMLADDGRRRAMAGQAVRVVDIPADAGVGRGLFEELHGWADGDKFARDLRKATERYYGSPLRAFLGKVVSRYDDIAQEVHDAIRQFVQEFCPEDADGQVKRVCLRFALVAAAGEIGTDLEILPWPKGEAIRAASRCFSAWLEQRGGNEAAEILTALKQIKAFFEAYGASRFETWGEVDDDARISIRAGFRKLNESGVWEYYVLPAVFKGEFCRGVDPKRLTAELIKRRMILPGEDGKSSKPVRVPGQPKRQRLYHFINIQSGT